MRPRNALTALGPLTVDYCRETLGTKEMAELFCRSDRLPLVLAKIGSPQALQVLKSVLDTTTSHAPSGALQAYCRILQRQHRLAPHLEHWESVVRCQIEAARQRRHMLVRATALTGNAFLLRVLREEYERHVDHIFLLIGVLATSVRMQAIRAQINSDNEEERAYARELLEHVLPAKLRPETIALINDRRWSTRRVAQLEKVAEVESSNNKRKFRRKRRGESTEEASPSALLLEIPGSETSEPAVLGAIYAVLQGGYRDVLPLVKKYLSHSSRVIRETAEYTLGRMETAENLAVQHEALAQDASPKVSDRARSIVSPGKPGLSEGRENMIVVEKMLFLGNVSLFSNIGTNDLADIASIAREASYPSGYQLIQEGEYGDHMFLIVDGEVRIHRGQTSLKVLGRKEFFGEMGIIDGEPRSASATAVSDCFLLRIDKDDFQDLLSTHSSAALAVMRVLTQRLRECLPVLERVAKGM